MCTYDDVVAALLIACCRLLPTIAAACQKAHWNAGHKYTCAGRKDKKRQQQPQPQPAQPRSAVPPADTEDPKQMSVRALKAELHSLGADWKHCVEKSELVELLVASRAAWPVSKQVSPVFEFGTTDGRATVAAVREA